MEPVRDTRAPGGPSPIGFTTPTVEYGAGTTERITEDGRLRITEDGRDIRIIEHKPLVLIPTEPPITALSDIQTTWDPWLLHGDWLFIPPDLVTGRDLETAATISLFTDRLALPADPLPDPNDGDRRGWWADWEFPGGNIGSRLWLISREKQTEDTRRRAEDYCREALQWMLDDDVADRVEVTAAWNTRTPGRLDVDVTITRDRNVLLKRNYSWAWGQLYHAIR
jgi:phage gp46-like protein